MCHWKSRPFCSGFWKMPMFNMGIAGVVLSALSPAAFALTTISVTPINPMGSLLVLPPMTIGYEDSNGNGLFDASELVSFSAVTALYGQGSTATVYRFDVLLSVPAVPGVANAGYILSTYNGEPLPAFCSTAWCIDTLRTYLSTSPQPTQLLMGFAFDRYTYAVTAVPEPQTALLLTAGAFSLCVLAQKRRHKATPIENAA